MNKRWILILSIFVMAFSFSYYADALDCGECVCNPIEGGGEVRHQGFNLERDSCPDERPNPICGNEHYAEDCESYCVCSDSPDEERPQPRCGDGTVNRYNELCDGNDFNERTCNDYRNFNRGSLRCTDECEIDTRECSYQPENVELSLEIGNGDMMCPKDSERLFLKLRNNGRDLDDVFLYDTVFYDSNCDGAGRVYLNYNFVFDCGDVEYQSSCVKSYPIWYYFPGCYYHNAYASSGELDELREG